jgi:hypothetical protein
MKLIYTLRNFAKAPENVCKFTSSLLAKFNFIDQLEENGWTRHVGTSTERHRNSYKILIRISEGKEMLEDPG